MALYLLPKDRIPEVEKYLYSKHPIVNVMHSIHDFAEVKEFVLRVCDSTTLEQPALKLISLFDSIRFSYWFGIILHNYEKSAVSASVDHSKNSFLFHGYSRTDKWELLKLY